MRYKSTNTTVYSAKYHIVWCPKYRRALLSGHLASRLRELIVDVVEDRGGEVLELEVMPDHVHLLAEVPPQIALSRLMQSLKGQTSCVLRSEYPQLLSTRSLWTPSWLLSTVGGASLDVVKRYVENQKDAARWPIAIAYTQLPNKKTFANATATTRVSFGISPLSSSTTLIVA